MLKNTFLNRLSKKISRIGDSVSFDRANSVGILSIYENFDQLKELTLELEQLGKSPRIATLITKPKKNTDYPKHTFTTKDISITGTIQSDELLYFTKQKFDFLLCLDDSGNKILKYILSKTNAQHRIGFYNPNYEGILNMLIKLNPEVSPVSQMIKYMKMIKHD